ncbi:hypothetical protein L6V77_23830 [Myxococcota bacterium]|nr:hypothetical protein [Myxococcota bacterium]
MRLKSATVFVAAVLGSAACDASPATDAPDVDAAAPDARGPDAAGLDASPPDATGPDAAPPDAAGPDAAPSCPVQFAYDPLAGAALQTFPDDFYTRPDPGTPTGLRPSMAPELAPWLPAIVGGYESVFRQLETLDGWGTTAGVILRFTGPVASADLPERALRLVSLAGDVATDVPFEIRTADDGATLILWPMVPLAPATRHGVVVTRALRTPDGGCVDPSPTFDVLLEPEPALDPRLAPLAPRYRALLDRTATAVEDFVGGTVFTTQSIVETSLAIAADVNTRRVGWTTPPTCRDEPLFRICDGVFTAADYRVDEVVAGTTPTRMYDLPVRAFLPPPTPEPSGPRPTVLFGHGLGSDRGQAAALAEFAAPLGLITVAIDAPAHGQHPTAEGDADIVRIAGFFGIDILEQSLDGLRLRDHWRQATYDKLQLVRLLLDDGDLDGDALPDVEPERLAYLGVSLGGIMGPELLALSPAVGLGVLSVPGGRVASIISDGPTFSVLVRAMTPPGTPPGEVARFFPVLQTLIERGDAANYAPHVLRDRLPGAGDRAPHLLFDMALDDAIVPNVCNRALARALGIPHIPPVLQPVGIVPVLDGAPVRGNLDDGRTTAGLFQFDRVVERAGEPVVRAEHDNLAKSTEGLLQATHFLQTWVDTGLAEIIDPYAVLETPPLP